MVAWLLIALAIEMVMFDNPTIQTYTKAEMTTEPVNLFDNKFIFSVLLDGFTNNTIDPRAGVLEVVYKEREKNGVAGTFLTEQSDRIPLQLCQSDPVQSVSTFLHTGALTDALPRSYCLPQETTIDGYMEMIGSQFPTVIFSKCRDN